MYRHWHDDQNEYTKIILKPGLEKQSTNRAEERSHEPA